MNRLSMQRVISWATVSILALINALFAWKYGLRFNGGTFGIAAAIAASACPPLLFFLYRSERIPPVQTLLRSKLTSTLLVVGVVAGALVFFKLYPQERLRVDRYEMIRLFWDNFFSQRCPYCPRIEGTNVPGPFPFYFYAALPFYLTGETGWYSVAGFLLFAGIVTTAKGLSRRWKNCILLLCVTSPAFMFEIGCRSTNFLNGSMLLFCTLMIYGTKPGNTKAALVSGAIAGLVLSTRSLAFLTIALAVVFTFKRRLFSRGALAVAGMASGVFLASFVPVIVACGREFLTFNPFTVQALSAPPPVSALFAAAALALAYRSGSIFTLYTINGYVFTALVAFYCGELMIDRGPINAILGNSIDISYFSLAMPFLLMGLGVMRNSERSQPLEIPWFGRRKDWASHAT